MQIVDSQVHVWVASTPERAWLPPSPDIPAPHKPQPFTPDDLLRDMDRAGVQGAVLVTPLWEGVRNDVVLAAAQAHPDRFAVMGRFDVTAPDARDLIPTWRNQRGMLGLRLLFVRGDRPLLTEGGADWLWPEAEKARVPIMLFVQHADMHFVDRIAERHPALKLVIDHLGLTKGKDDEAFRELDKVLALAQRPNVAVKVSCLPHYTTDPYPHRRLHPYLRRVYDTFGPKRMFWGSDLTRLERPYRDAVTMFTEHIPWLTADDKEWIMGRGLCEWLGWELRCQRKT
jgi:predicted TIM-barrel fold metal-dependent hydrolase